MELLERTVEQLNQRMTGLGGKVTVLEDQFLITLNGNSEEQLLIAMQMCLERPRTLLGVLEKSHRLYKSGTNLHCRHDEALHLVLRALKIHLSDKDVQMAGIQFILLIRMIRIQEFIDGMENHPDPLAFADKQKELEMNEYTKNLVVQALIDGMENHLDSPAVVKNCCLGLSEYPLTPVYESACGPVANLLARALEMHNSNATIQQEVVSLLKSMVLKEKMIIEMGEVGVIEIMSRQILRKVQTNTCDDVMENIWSFLWSVTEIPANCERFLEAHGLAMFSRCYAKFADQHFKLVRNMMGVMVKIAKVCRLRSQLMTNEYLELFCKLLDKLNGGMEVSYMSAGLLALLVSDEQCWTKSGVTLSRGRVNMLIVQATEKWNLNTRLYINCMSIKPILGLLSQWHAFGSQHWAVWALANATTEATETEKRKYYRLFTEEGGMEHLEQLSTDPHSTNAIRQLACIVIKNIEDWRNISQV